jgi:shikimate kinase
MKNIVLIGMPYAGKTSVGKVLARKMSKRFFDTDIEIMRTTQKSISDIFLLHGEKYFRSLERNILKKIPVDSNLILSTGGGILTYKNNYLLIKNLGCVIYLYCNQNLILKRLKLYNNNNKAVVTQNNLKEIFSQRHKLYLKTCNFILNCAKKSIEQIAEEILLHQAI